MNEQQAVVLLSGGLDSTTVLAIARSQGFSVIASAFNTASGNRLSWIAPGQYAVMQGVLRHLVLRVDLDAIGGSALTTDIEVPKDRSQSEMEAEIPVTYVPGRNILFLAHALSWAEVLGAFDIFLGINAVDYSGYPDCRPEFLSAFEQMANLGTKAGATGQAFRFHAPLIDLSKKEIILKGRELGVDYSVTHSCYDPVGEKACGRCDACRLRLQGFQRGRTDRSGSLRQRMMVEIPG